MIHPPELIEIVIARHRACDPCGLVEKVMPAQRRETDALPATRFQPVDHFRVDRRLIVATFSKVVPCGFGQPVAELVLRHGAHVGHLIGHRRYRPDRDPVADDSPQ